MDGILVVDKPAGLTSHDVVARARRILKTKRIGHTGTLDPFATGVLVLLIGKATRLAQFLDKDPKEYVATVGLGFETDTGDLTGSPRSKVQSPKSVTLVEIETVLAKFRGELLQTPPMYSAKKVDGKKLYELARRGIELEREPVRISIYELDLLEENDSKEDGHTFVIRVSCSAGTYIRTLAQDIGRKLGVGAHLTELRRTAAGQFDLRQSYTLDDLKRIGADILLIPMDNAVSHLPEFNLPQDRIEKTKNGLSTRVNNIALKHDDLVRMTEGGGNVIAIGVFDEVEKTVQPKIVLV
jgi:tRNA pseudouridine55 synthase